MAAMMATITMRTVGSVLDDDDAVVAVVEVESLVVELEVEEGDSLGVLLEADGVAEVVGEGTVVVDIALIQVPIEK